MNVILTAIIAADKSASFHEGFSANCFPTPPPPPPPFYTFPKLNFQSVTVYDTFPIR